MNSQRRVVQEQGRQEVLRAGKAAAKKGNQPSREYLQELTSSGLDEDTARQLRNLLSQDFVLANLEEEEVHEFRWLTRLKALLVKAMHPPEESAFQGEYRKWVRDDPKDGLSALSDLDELLIDEYVEALIARATRGKEGFQQEQMSKSYDVTEVKDDKQDTGIIGRLVK